MPYGIGIQSINKILQVFRNYGNVGKVILYGSRAKGDYRPGSDIDLTIIGEGLNLTSLNRISNDLDELMLPYIFDLSLFNQISNNDLIGYIDRVGKVFYERSSDVAMPTPGDHKP